jgi:subtilisin family serine protease
VVFIAAAGNESSNTDLISYYPANYKISNIISVAAVDTKRNILSFSNYGASTIDLAAPGKNIYSTLPGGKYGPMSGTSQATAIVCAVAARLMAEKTQLTRHPSSVLKSILQNGTQENTLKGKTKYRVGINLEI